jgi:topoisomerase-4 subunit A
VIYRDGKAGFNHIKRFAVTGVTRDREYDVTKGTQGSRILYFSANMNGEAETVKVILKPKPRQKLLVFEKDFSEVAIKGRGSMGNLLTKAEVHKISLKQKGSSTLGGRMVWFDRDILRLNYDGRGEELGEFQSEDLILVVQQNGEFYTTNFDLSNHYEDNILVIEKNDSMKVWTAVYYDADQKYFYLKRFLLEGTVRKQNFLGENPKNRLMLLTDEVYPRIEVVFGGHDAFREPLVLDAEEFIGVKGFKAKGKRISTFEIEVINELDPIRFAPKIDQKQEEREEEEAVTEIESEKSNTDIIDEITGQMKLFDE